MRILIAILMCSVFAISVHGDDPDQKLSPKLQRALEVKSVADHLQGIVVLCANACEPKSSSSGMTSGKRQHKPLKVTKPTSRMKHDTAKSIINNMRALTCVGARACVDLIARKKMCKAKTVKCTSAGCKCTKR